MLENYYIYNGDGRLERRDNTLRVVNSEGIRRDLPVERISDIYIMSEMDFNTKLIDLLGKYGIVVHFFNHYTFYRGSFYPRETLLAGNLIIKQSEMYLDYEKILDLAKRFIIAASSNIYRNLRYYNGRGKNVKKQMELIQEYKKMISGSKSIEELMAYEGNIRKVYYQAWNVIVDQEINFNKRVMHPPDNMINTLISFVNTLVYTRVLSQIYKTQLNPTISYLHEPGVRRFSLCLDLAEIFKPLIGDRLIFSLLNRNQITEKSFVEGLNGLNLTKQASNTITRELDERLKKTIKHKDLQKNVSYDYLIRLEAYKLIKHILGEKTYEGFEIWW